MSSAPIIQHKILVLRSLLPLTVAVLQVRFLPFARLAARLREPLSAASGQSRENEIRTAQAVGRAIRRAAERLPFAAVCLPQALAAHALLRRRGIPGTLHLGVRRTEDGTLPAHAWLSCHSTPILGHEEIDTFTLLHEFSPISSPLFADPCLKIICDACQFDIQPDTAIPLPENWKHLLELADRHRVAPLLLHHLKKYPAGMIDPELMSGLIQRQEAVTRQNMLSVAVLTRIAKLFEEQKIDFLLLKGLSVGMRYYPNPNLRHSRDLDLLIRPEQFELAEKLLKEMGFERTEFEPTRDWHKELQFKQEYHFEYHCSRTGMTVELHWRLSINPYGYQVSFDELMAKSKVMKLGASQIRTMEELEQFVYLCEHGSKHFWFRIKWLADIYAVIRDSRFDAEAAWKQCKKTKSGRAVALAMHMTKELFGQEDLLNLHRAPPLLISHTRIWIQHSSEIISQHRTLVRIFKEEFVCNILLRPNWKSQLWNYRLLIWRGSFLEQANYPAPLKIIYPFQRMAHWIFKRIQLT